ncbi:MAG: hypothetical protein FWD23_12440, partial [Oscillospiraceae bacterium]|nr:hypothetical protein [Oscillospiraceae bacterium]
MKDKLMKTNIKGLKLVSKWRKRFIPLSVLNGLFANLAPFVTIYMSAEIVNELAGEKNKERLLFLVLFTIIADLSIVILSGAIDKLTALERISLENAEKRAFTEFGFKMDYEHLENPEIRQNRRKIDESKCINSFGIWAMLHSFQYITAGVTEIILSVIFTSGLFVLIFSQAKDMTGAVVYPAAIILLVFLSVFISLRNSKKLSKLGDDISNTNIEENKIDEGFWHEYKTMQDIRIYDMGIIFRKNNERRMKAAVSGNRKYWFGWRNTQIPDQFISQGINFTIYAFVCLNALRGLFETGSVIKYIGFITRLVNAFKNMSAHIALIKMNTPFLAHYLNFFDIENKMHKGTLTTEKRADNEYEIEFHNVSFKYPGSETYALKNLNLKL